MKLMYLFKERGRPSGSREDADNELQGPLASVLFNPQFNPQSESSFM